MPRAKASLDWSVKNLGLTEIRSHYGLGFLPATSGKTPSQGLAVLAVRIADAIDLDGTNEICSLSSSDLPGGWFSKVPPLPKIQVQGCISIGAKPAGNGLLGFIVEASDDDAAKDLASRALVTSASPAIVLVDGSRLLLLIKAEPTGSKRRLARLADTVELAFRHRPAIGTGL